MSLVGVEVAPKVGAGVVSLGSSKLIARMDC